MQALRAVYLPPGCRRIPTSRFCLLKLAKGKCTPSSKQWYLWHANSFQGDVPTQIPYAYTNLFGTSRDWNYHTMYIALICFVSLPLIPYSQ